MPIYKGGMHMYFPVNDILNDTVLGIPKTDLIDWSSAIDTVIENKESEE